MENSAINSKCDEDIGKGMKRSKNLQIRLMGHCIICLRKVSTKRNGTRSHCTDEPEVAPKSVVSTPGFLTTFNQVWAVLQCKWKEKKDGSSSENIDISLENVIKNGGGVSKVSFSRAPTICQLCCDKVLAVENLIKAVRQQVREINILVEEGRKRPDGGFSDFEKALRDNGLEESVARATLEFVGIFGSSCFPEEFQAIEGDHVSMTMTVANMQDDNGAIVDWVGDGNDEMSNSHVDSDDDNEDEMISGASGAEDDSDPDYVKEEPEETDNDDDSIDEDANESEEEMEVDEADDKNEANDLKIKKDPLDPSKEKEESNKYPCSCGRNFPTKQGRSVHLKMNKKSHPEFGSANSGRQTCDLCGEWILYSCILEHLTDNHLNGQAEWVKRCPDEKCRYMCVTPKAFHVHVHRSRTDCTKIWKETMGPVCEICGFKGTNMYKIRNHVRDNHENGKEKKLECPISDCGKMFGIKQSVDYHLEEHRSRPVSQQICDKCGEDLKVEEMQGHLKDKHGIEEVDVIGCKQCPFKFSGRDEMVEHLYEHRVAGIRCDICGEDKFDRYCDFREHYFVIHKLCPKKYKCGEGDSCDTWFWRKETKDMHQMNMHKKVDNVGGDRGGVDPKNLKKMCDMCDNYEYVKEYTLIKHKIRVHGAEPFRCDICGETFDQRGKFTKHKKEHAGIPFQKEWSCEVEGCGKIFKKKIDWKRHTEVGHSGARPHICEICGKGFGFPQGLRTHRDAVHLGLRPCVCEVCGERYSTMSVLQKHKLIHTGERPFSCEICGQRFRHKGVLTTHLKGHEEKGQDFKPNGPMKQIRKRKCQ